MKHTVRTIALSSAAIALVISAIPAQAQFRGLLRDAQRDTQQGTQAAEGCEEEGSGDVARGVLGGLLGGAARRTANSMGLGTFVPVSTFTDQIAAVIACKLEPEEQEQAAKATLDATSVTDEEGNQLPPEVGRSASWESGTRDEVSGTSTVTAREASSDDNDCITVTDVIIVEGEETRAEKRMCRLAGSPRYTIVA